MSSYDSTLFFWLTTMFLWLNTVFIWLNFVPLTHYYVLVFHHCSFDPTLCSCDSSLCSYGSTLCFWFNTVFCVVCTILAKFNVEQRRAGWQRQEYPVAYDHQAPLLYILTGVTQTSNNIGSGWLQLVYTAGEPDNHRQLGIPASASLLSSVLH